MKIEKEFRNVFKVWSPTIEVFKRWKRSYEFVFDFCKFSYERNSKEFGTFFVARVSEAKSRSNPFFSSVGPWLQQSLASRHKTCRTKALRHPSWQSWRRRFQLGHSCVYQIQHNKPGGNPPPTRVAPPTRLETGSGPYPGWHQPGPRPGRGPTRVGGGLTPTRPESGLVPSPAPGRVDVNLAPGRVWARPGLGLGRPALI